MKLAPLGKIASTIFKYVSDPEGPLAASAKQAIEAAKKDPDKLRATFITKKNEEILRGIRKNLKK
jgi:hypothetical protein